MEFILEIENYIVAPVDLTDIKEIGDIADKINDDTLLPIIKYNYSSDKIEARLLKSIELKDLLKEPQLFAIRNKNSNMLLGIINVSFGFGDRYNIDIIVDKNNIEYTCIIDILKNIFDFLVDDYNIHNYGMIISDKNDYVRNVAIGLGFEEHSKYNIHNSVNGEAGDNKSFGVIRYDLNNYGDNK